jgi:hypothetical protein
MARLILLMLLLLPAPAFARDTVSASSPQDLSVTVYRDPDREENSLPATLSSASLNGFAMISETRTVTLPAGPSTIRFEGVAEGMVAVTAIVTGLPGGTIEKNRNGNLLSPASLVDGSLGNRVTISRMNPATGVARAESAIVRTRADGGLVLQTSEGFEAVRCAGMPETLKFGRVPAGLSAEPVFSIDTNSPEAGSYRVTLTYLATGFDWQANYLATLAEGTNPAKQKFRLLAWLTVANDNGQSFPGATLLAVAGDDQRRARFQLAVRSARGKPAPADLLSPGKHRAGDGGEAAGRSGAVRQLSRGDGRGRCNRRHGNPDALRGNGILACRGDRHEGRRRGPLATSSSTACPNPSRWQRNR